MQRSPSQCASRSDDECYQGSFLGTFHLLGAESSDVLARRRSVPGDGGGCRAAATSWTSLQEEQRSPVLCWLRSHSQSLVSGKCEPRTGAELRGSQ